MYNYSNVYFHTRCHKYPNRFADTNPWTQPPQGAFNKATFVYNGDGKRVKSTFNGTTTTYFVGNHYEVTGSTITKYYYAGAQRIVTLVPDLLRKSCVRCSAGVRTHGKLNYLIGDHLGSTSLITDLHRRKNP